MSPSLIGKSASLALAAFFAAGIASNAMAETPWQKDHPRRVEVNHRLANQNRRIHHEVKDGQITHAQAASLHRDDATIRHEERGMASQDGSHLTRADDRSLNQQENQVSRDIGQ